MTLIYIFVLLLNIIAVGLIYYCLEGMEKKDRVLFIAVGIAAIYMLTLLAYWISTKNISIKQVSENAKNMIIFLFVPINSILVLPILAKSYIRYKEKKLQAEKLRNRVIALVIPLLIVLIVECIYFKNIQQGIINLIENKKTENQTTQVKQQNTENYFNTTIQNNMQYNNEETNIQNNQLSNHTSGNEVKAITNTNR